MTPELSSSRIKLPTMLNSRSNLCLTSIASKGTVDESSTVLKVSKKRFRIVKRKKSG